MLLYNLFNLLSSLSHYQPMHSYRRHNYSLEHELAQIPEHHHLLEDSLKLNSILAADESPKQKKKTHKNRKK